MLALHTTALCYKMITSQKVISSHLIFFLLHLCLGYARKNCPVAACREDGPAVRFPFWLKGRQPETCGYPGFELSCSKKNQTLIEFPTSGKFLVTKISYENQYIDISDPGRCIAQRLMRLNVTGSPFTIFWSENFTLLNCSSRVEGQDLAAIGCLSSSTRNVYAAHASMAMSLDLSSCGFIANVEASFTLSQSYSFPHRCIPYTYRLPLYYFPRSFKPPYNQNGYHRCTYPSGYVRTFPDYLNSLYNFTRLLWAIPDCDGCEYGGGNCRFKSNTSRQLECFKGNENFIPVDPAYTIYPNEEKSSINIKGLCIGIPIAALSLLLIVTLIMLYLRSSKAEVREKRKKIRKFLEDCRSLNPTRYSFADIQKMTNEFKKQLGQGGYGTVFKGELENGVPVAVKVLNNSKGNGEDFTNEVSTIGRIHHVNVVRLLGYCADASDRALVYEFMTNRSLDKFIFPVNSKRPRLGWGKLQDIAIGVARGIEYLHQGCDQRILHFDIKPQNVLLDIDFNPKISDFGLAKLLPKKDSVVPITAVRGTMGYIAPEVYFSGNIGNVSYKTDVYSFGMLLFEIVGGRKNKDLTVENTSQVYFPQWVYNRLADGEDLGIKEEKEGDADIAKKLSVVGLWCVQWEPNNRPSISTVIQMLEGRTGSLPLPPDPFASLSSEESDMNVP
ncbi:hypothetical protein REPUB_Repub17cG0185100 [Reevesia pubescens]